MVRVGSQMLDENHGRSEAEPFKLCPVLSPRLNVSHTVMWHITDAGVMCLPASHSYEWCMTTKIPKT